MISGGLTRHHQSLDVPINNPLKDELRKNIIRIALNKNKTAHKFLKKINQLGIRSEVFRLMISIINISFEAEGVTLNIDGSRNEKFNECNWLLGYEQ